MRSIAVILCLLFCNTVFAQEPVYERYKLPIGTRITDKVQTYQCYNLGEYEKLLTMDASLKKADTDVPNYQSTLVLYLDKINNLQAIINLDNSSSALDKTEILRKDKLVTDLAKKNVQLTDELIKRKRILRITVGIASTLVVGVFAGTYLGLRL